VKYFLLDTGIAGDYINGRNQVRQRTKDEIARGARVGICVPVLAELYYGAEGSRDPRRTMQLLQRALPTWRVWPLTNGAAAEFGRIRAELDRIGRPMQPIDVMIAAIAFSLGNCTVVTTDSDLSAVPGLAVENWAA
jgi:tRNA(fMet)-specific endonuclease VapC